jgi:hypothetical protein
MGRTPGELVASLSSKSGAKPPISGRIDLPAINCGADALGCIDLFAE